MKKLIIGLLASALSAPGYARLSNVGQQFTSEVNLLSNPGFEQSTSQWEKTGSSTLVTTTTAANVYIGTSAGVWDASAASEFLRTRLTGGTVPAGLEGQTCVATFWYLFTGSSGDIVANVNDGTSDLGADQTIAPTTGQYRQQVVPFACPDQGTDIRLELESTADAAAITIDQAFLGNLGAVLTNVLPLAYENTDTRTNLGATGTLTHNSNIPVSDQQWVATVEIDGGDDLQLENGWITDKDVNSVDYDFTSLAGADTVTVKLFDTRQNTPLINNLSDNYVYGPASAAPATTVAHGLGVVPKTIRVMHEGQSAAGQWDDVTSANHCSVDSTNFYCDFTPITIDATHRIFVGVSTSVNPDFFDGQVQKLGIGSNENDDMSPDADDLLIYSTTDPVGVTFRSQSSGRALIHFQDTTGTTPSGVIEYDNSSNEMTFKNGNTEAIKIVSGQDVQFNNGGIQLENGGSVLGHYEVTTHATTFTWNGSGGTSGSQTLDLVRIGDNVTICIPSFTATTGTSSTQLANDTLLPADFRPVGGTVGIAWNGVDNVNGWLTGQLAITGSGDIRFTKRGATATFVNSSTSGTNDGVSGRQCGSYAIN